MIGFPITGWITSYNKSTFLLPSDDYYIHPTITDALRFLSMASLAHPSPSAKGFHKGIQLLQSSLTYPLNLYSMLFEPPGYGSEHMQMIHMPLASISRHGNPSISGSFSTTLLLVEKSTGASQTLYHSLPTHTSLLQTPPPPPHFLLQP